MFPKESKSMINSKPDIIPRVPIDKNEFIEKQKAKLIYQEECLANVLKNKQKIDQEYQKKLEQKLKDSEK